MIREKALELVAALRSGEFKQARNALRTEKGFCCLGVACELEYRKQGKEAQLVEGFTLYKNYYYGDDVSCLPGEVQAAFGFFDNVGSLNGYDSFETTKGACSCLASANDIGISFDEIADLIMTHWEEL